MTEPKKPEKLPDPYVSALGPVPPEHFDNDQRCPDDDKVDTAPGSVHDALTKRDKK
jgi:hypothetical protein